MTLIDGKAVSEQVKQEIAAEVAAMVRQDRNVLIWQPFWLVMMVEAKHMLLPR